MVHRKIVLDCDPGTDDALALLLASVYLKERLLCLVSTYGNVPLCRTHSNLKGLAALLGMGEVPVVRGVAYPLGKSDFAATDYHGENGLCGISLPILVKEDDHEDGIDRLYERICGEEKVIYAAVGPLTNLAELLRRYPDASERIECAVIMGGGIRLGNTPCGAEYNFSLDPQAVGEVLKSPLKITLVPLDFTHTLAFSEDEVAEIVGLSREELETSGESAYHTFGRIFYGNLDSSLKNGNRGAIIHDGAAVAGLCPGIFCETEENFLRSDETGRLFTESHGKIADVAVRMQKEALAMLMKEGFRRLRG